MLPVSFLFEGVTEKIAAAQQRQALINQKIASQKRATGVMDNARNYVDERIAILKQQMALGRINAKAYQAQLKQFLADKRNSMAGTFVEKKM